MGVFGPFVVGIFSRENTKTYEWLTQMITKTLGEKNVRSVKITNKWTDFQEEVPKCSFGILYHSRTRGRLNVVDVTDSLYDEELKYLSRAYGRENVVVVMDHLEDSSNENAAMILKEQPSITSCSGGLFLFNTMIGNRSPSNGPRMEDLQRYITNRAPWKPPQKKNWALVISVILLVVAGVWYRDDQSRPSPPNVVKIDDHLSTVLEKPGIDNVPEELPVQVIRTNIEYDNDHKIRSQHDEEPNDQEIRSQHDEKPNDQEIRSQCDEQPNDQEIRSQRDEESSDHEIRSQHDEEPNDQEKRLQHEEKPNDQEIRSQREEESNDQEIRSQRDEEPNDQEIRSQRDKESSDHEIRSQHDEEPNDHEIGLLHHE